MSKIIRKVIDYSRISYDKKGEIEKIHNKKINAWSVNPLKSCLKEDFLVESTVEQPLSYS